MRVRIYLTGRVAIEIDGEVLVREREFRGRQGRLVFAYLVSERTRPVPREELAAVVWPDELPDAWEGALSALTSRLGALVEAPPVVSAGIAFSRGLGLYQLKLSLDVWIDLEAGISAVDHAEGALRMGTPDRVLGPATVGSSIARRPFLPGVEGEWVDGWRRRLERQLIRALDCLTRMRLASSEPDLAVETALEAVAVDPLREQGYQLVMQAYEAGGNRAKAVETYHRLRLLLAKELGTEPSAETEALYLQSLA